MSHNCRTTSCRRKTGERCETCRRPGGGHQVLTIDPGNPEPRRQRATPIEIGAAVDMYFDGISYRRVAENIGDYFHRPTNATTVYRWVRDLTAKAKDVVEKTRVDTGPEWVADEMHVTVGGEKYWLFNVMDSDTRFILAAYLSKERTARAAATTMAMARDRASSSPVEIKTDGLRSYQQGIKTAFPTRPVSHVVSKGIRAIINNNMSERLQGILRDRDKTLRGMKHRNTGQEYLDGLVLNYNYFRSHQSLRGKTPSEAAGAESPFKSWRDVASMTG